MQIEDPLHGTTRRLQRMEWTAWYTAKSCPDARPAPMLVPPAMPNTRNAGGGLSPGAGQQIEQALGAAYKALLQKPFRDIRDLASDPSQIPGALSDLAPGLPVAEIPRALSGLVGGIKGLGAIAGKPSPSSSSPANMGDLTPDEISQIQTAANRAGRPLDVVGSAARGSRRPNSDIDYTVTPGSLPYYKGLENQLPAIDPNHGIIPGGGNPYIGPSIRFDPR
jgi:hypothetical protein